jgi:hypothetical protein
MKESQRLGLLASVVQMLDEAGSWTGRMHIQKLVYFGQELLGVQSGYEFVLYQRGPYSFDLDGDIRSLRSIAAVDIKPSPPYGPSYFRTSLGGAISKLSPVQEDLKGKLEALAGELGPKTASELELLATTHYVLHEGRCKTDKDIVDRVVSLKPQFTPGQVDQALGQVRQLETRFQ